MVLLIEVVVTYWLVIMFMVVDMFMVIVGVMEVEVHGGWGGGGVGRRSGYVLMVEGVVEMEVVYVLMVHGFVVVVIMVGMVVVVVVEVVVVVVIAVVIMILWMKVVMVVRLYSVQFHLDLLTKLLQYLMNRKKIVFKGNLLTTITMPKKTMKGCGNFNVSYNYSIIISLHYPKSNPNFHDITRNEK